MPDEKYYAEVSNEYLRVTVFLGKVGTIQLLLSFMKEGMPHESARVFLSDLVEIINKHMNLTKYEVRKGRKSSTESAVEHLEGRMKSLAMYPAWSMRDQDAVRILMEDRRRIESKLAEELRGRSQDLLDEWAHDLEHGWSNTVDGLPPSGAYGHWLEEKLLASRSQEDHYIDKTFFPQDPTSRLEVQKARYEAALCLYNEYSHVDFCMLHATQEERLRLWAEFERSAYILGYSREVLQIKRDIQRKKKENDPQCPTKT